LFFEPLRLTCDYLGMRFLGVHYAKFIDERLAAPDAQTDAAGFGNTIWQQLARAAS
jgi:hypothetical protein